MKLAFIGLGVMGFPMAGHLQAVGHAVTVYNRTGAKAEAWVEKYRGDAAPTPAAAANDAEIVFACVGNDDDLRQVTTGPDGAFAAMQPGATFIDHTTASADVARELAAKARELGLHFLDAPVSGGQAGAENGKLCIMVGGEAAIYARAEPILQIYGKAVVHMGEAGRGQLAKMVNQICIAGTVQALAEGLAFAERANLDGSKLLSVISQGGAQSWQMDNRGATMLAGKFDHGFALDWMIKDLGIVLAESQHNGAKLPVTEQIIDFYRDLSAKGDGRLDTSALIKRLR
jgi:3-hydroxyisobutyrate dehydrogenase-like beta-hydroxyacid dehydrogenase